MRTNRTNRRPHPIRRVLREQGRSIAWLSRQIKRGDSYTRGVVNDHWPATADFRLRCARALQLPQDVLFHGGSSNAGQPEDTAPTAGSDDDRAATAVVSLSVPVA
jgi:hypothetical protein